MLEVVSFITKGTHGKCKQEQQWLENLAQGVQSELVLPLPTRQAYTTVNLEIVQAA